MAGSVEVLFSKADLLSITDEEVQNGSSRFFKEFSRIPAGFTYPNIYTKTVESVLGLRPTPEARLQLKSGYEGVDTFQGIRNLIWSHLGQDSKTEVNILVIAHALNCICEIKSIESVPVA